MTFLVENSHYVDYCNSLDASAFGFCFGFSFISQSLFLFSTGFRCQTWLLIITWREYSFLLENICIPDQVSSPIPTLGSFGVSWRHAKSFSGSVTDLNISQPYPNPLTYSFLSRSFISSNPEVIFVCVPRWQTCSPLYNPCTQFSFSEAMF